MTTKVGIYRSYYGPVPTDSSGKPLHKDEWPKKRPHSWVARWFGTDGQRYSRSFKIRKEAERFYESKQQEVRVGQADPPPSITIKAFAAEHEKVMIGQIARASLADQKRALESFISHVGQDISLHRIKPRDAEAFVASRLRNGVAIGTVNKDIRTLKRIFNLAIAPRGYLNQNPFASIKQRKQSTKPIRYVTPQEFQKLLTAATTLWWRAFLSVAYTTGARLGELLHLTWADVDFEQDRVRIARKDASYDLIQWEPKDHEGRVVPCPAQATQLMADLQSESAEGCPYVFVPPWRWDHIRLARDAGTWNDEQKMLNNLNRRLATLRKIAGVSKMTFHDLRRSCITNWARTLPTHVVQKLAGHSDIKTTQHYYLAVRQGDLEEARRVQAGILQQKVTDQEVTN
jgi:integrase